MKQEVKTQWRLEHYLVHNYHLISALSHSLRPSGQSNSLPSCIPKLTASHTRRAWKDNPADVDTEMKRVQPFLLCLHVQWTRLFVEKRSMLEGNTSSRVLSLVNQGSADTGIIFIILFTIILIIIMIELGKNCSPVHCHQPCCSQPGNSPSVHVSDNNSSADFSISSHVFLVPIISTMEICCC